LNPINLGEPYSPDSDFDSTVRIPIKPTKIPSFRAPAAPYALGQQPQAQPQVAIGTPAAAPMPQAQPQPQPTPAPTPTPTPSAQPGAYDPSQLNFEGSVYTGASPTTNEQVLRRPSAGDLAAIQKFMDDNDIKINKDWRAELNADPAAFVKKHWQVSGLGGYTQNLLQGQGQVTNPEGQAQYLGQQVYNSAIERLKQASAVDSRDQDEQVLAMLASRGLLNSGIASRELARLQQARMQNLYEVSNRLNEMLLTNELGRLTQRDLETLQADLQKRNNEAYLRLQSQLMESSQPSGLAQIAGTAIGTALPFLLSPKAPGLTDEPASRVYGGDVGSTPQVAQRGNSYRQPRYEPY